jgi:hypothetical protein
MSRRSDPIRIETARRSAAIARLVGAGHPEARAEELVEVFIAEHDDHPTRADWDRFDAWLVGRRRPPARSPPQFPQGATFRQFSIVSLTACVPVVP